MSTRRAHVVIPEELVRDIEQLVGRRQGSAFLTQAAEEKLMRFRQLKAVESSAANWKDEDHPNSRARRDIFQSCASRTTDVIGR